MKLNNQYIVLKNGKKIKISEILRLSSFDLYQTSLHYDICLGLSKRRASDMVEQRFLMNLYALKSSLVRSATALTAYIYNSNSPVAEFFICSKLLSILNPELTKDVIVHDWHGREPGYLNKSQGLLLLAKAVAHKLFRLMTQISQRRNGGEFLVRGWVEVTPKMYETEVRCGTVLIYPFALNLIRQVKFIAWCSKEKINYELAGLPYSITKIAAQLAVGVSCDLILLDAEKNANRLHGEELLLRQPKAIFTSDEFETAAFLLYEELLASGVRVVNTAHGVGQYCPHICYSEFRVISDSQGRFYKERNPLIKYSLLPASNSRIAGIDQYEMSLEKPLAFVLVHQPFAESGLIAEDIAMRNLDDALLAMSQKLSITYFVKMHPNSNTRFFRMHRNKLKGQAIYDWSDLNKFRLIFVTVNSSVALDVRGLGPALVYAGTSFEPSLYFPEPILCIDESTAESVLESLMSVENWARASAVHAGEMILDSTY